MYFKLYVVAEDPDKISMKQNGPLFASTIPEEDTFADETTEFKVVPFFTIVVETTDDVAGEA